MTITEAIAIVSENIDTDEVRKFLQPHMDKYFAKGLKTWQENHLPDMVNKTIAGNPEETPEQKQIRELQADLETHKRRMEISSYARSKGMSEGIADLLTGLDTESSLKLLDAVRVMKEEAEHKVRAEYEKIITDKAKPGGGNTNPTFTKESIKQMSPQEVADNIGKPDFQAALRN